jgi:hypothetical protein
MDIRLNQASSRSPWACANLRAVVTTLLLLEKIISTWQESSILSAHREFRSPKSLSTKHLRLILLQDATNKPSGMMLLQEMTAPASIASIESLRNSRRICTFREISGREGRARKSLRMISLQNHENKPSGMILLQKNVGGGVGRRTSRAKLSPPRTSPPRPSWRSGARGGHKDIRSFAALPLRAKVMAIRSFRALTKSA